MNDVTIRNVDTPEWGVIVGQRSTTDPAGTIRRIVIDGLTSSQGNVGGSNNIFTLTAGMSVIDSSIVNARLRSIDRVLANTSSTVTGLEVEAVVGEIVSGAYFASTPVANTAVRLDVTSRTTVADWGTRPTTMSGADRDAQEAS